MIYNFLSFFMKEQQIAGKYSFLDIIINENISHENFMLCANNDMKNTVRLVMYIRKQGNYRKANNLMKIIMKEYPDVYEANKHYYFSKVGSWRDALGFDITYLADVLRKQYNFLKVGSKEVEVDNLAKDIPYPFGYYKKRIETLANHAFPDEIYPIAKFHKAKDEMLYHIRLVDHLKQTGNYPHLKYNKVPYLLLYNNNFLPKTQRFKTVSKPNYHEIFNKVFQESTDYNILENFDKFSSLNDTIPVIDGNCPSSASIGVVASSLLNDDWKDTFINYSIFPQLQYIEKDAPLIEKYNQVVKKVRNTSEYMSIYNIFNVVLRISLMNSVLPPKQILILTNKPLCEADITYNMNKIDLVFEEQELPRPRLVYWNLNDKQEFPFYNKEDNVVFLHGLSQETLVAVKKGTIDNNEELVKILISEFEVR